jgi:sugar lactone lactonase YvrE
MFASISSLLPRRASMAALGLISLFGLTLCACGGGSSTPPTPAATLPAIAAQPADSAVSLGTAVNFSVSASGTAPLAYQWQRNGVDIAGATSASYSLANPTLADHQASYRVRISNAAGSVNSNAATLRVSGIELFAGALNVGGETIDGPREVARLNVPSGLAFDATGNLWFAERGGIRKISPDGGVSTLNFPGLTPIENYFPIRVAFDRSGTLFFSDRAGYHIYKVSQAGVPSVVATLPQGSPGRGGGLNAPTGIGFDRAGNLYVSTCAGTRKIAADGSVTLLDGVDALATTGSGFPCPKTLRFDADDNLYFNAVDDSIGKITATGGKSTFVEKDKLPSYSSGMAFDSAGNLYVSGYNNIRKISPSGAVSLVAGELIPSGDSNVLGSLPGRFVTLLDIAIDAKGAVYAIDRNSILKIVFP